MEPAGVVADALDEEPLAAVVGVAVGGLVGEVLRGHAVGLEEEGEQPARRLLGDDPARPQVEDVGDVRERQPLVEQGRVGDLEGEPRLDERRRRRLVGGAVVSPGHRSLPAARWASAR